MKVSLSHFCLGSYKEIKMTEPPGNATEGVAKSVICSVAYNCTRNKPIIVWNYEDMHSSFHTKKISRNTFNAVSNLTFIGSLGDDGKSLTCTAQFITGKTSDSATIHIKSEYLHFIYKGHLKVKFNILLKCCSSQYHRQICDSTSRQMDLLGTKSGNKRWHHHNKTSSAMSLKQ